MKRRFNYDYEGEYYTDKLNFYTTILGNGSICFDLYDFSVMYHDIHDSLILDELEAFLYEYFEDETELRNIIFNESDIDTIYSFVKNYYEDRNYKVN